ncbi:MAG: hypothetical protein ACRDQ5_18925 [Sciscionella sp.]
MTSTPSATPPPPRRRRQPDYREEWLTEQQILTHESTNPNVWSWAVYFEHTVRDPEKTQAPQDSEVRKQLSSLAAEMLVTEGQEVAVGESQHFDEHALELAQQAAEDLSAGKNHIEEAKRVLSEPYPLPGGGTGTPAEVYANHKDDTQLAIAREREGNIAHRHTAMKRLKVILALSAMFILDLGVWAKWIGLAAPTSLTMILKWIMALVVAGVVSWSVDKIIQHLKEKHRVSADRRDAFGDHNRRREQQARNDNDLEPSLDLEEIKASDHDLKQAQQALFGVATVTGAFLAVRVASIVRDSGSPVFIAAVAAVGVGLLLAVAIVALGYLSCRGNTLGDRLHKGAETITEIEDDLQEAVAEVVADLDRASSKLADSQKASIQAEAKRADIMGEMWQALLLGCAWAHIPRSHIERPTLEQRSLHIATATQKTREALLPCARDIDNWLTNQRPTIMSHTIPAGTGTYLALPAGTQPSTRARAMDTPPGTQTVIIPYRVKLPARSRIPRIAGALAVVAIIAAGTITAVITSNPEQSQGSVQRIAAAIIVTHISPDSGPA